MQRREFDVLVIGGGLGGVAASLRVLEAGYTVCLTEQTDWLGGQATAQGVSALDEPRLIEQAGGTRHYYRFREGIRDYYFTRGLVNASAVRERFNPGRGWVSRLCFEPKAALASIDALLRPYYECGLLEVLYHVRPCAVTRKGDRITGVTVRGAAGKETELYGRFVIDATELGELLPLACIPYAAGADSADETGEPHAVPGAGEPGWTQAFTFPIALEFCPGENHTIPKPPMYEYFRDMQPYSLTLWYGRDGARRFPMFDQRPGDMAFWSYRRMIDAAQFGGAYPNDIAQINWPSNDYHLRSLIDVSPEAERQILREARWLSLGFLYWLQTEAPRDDGQGRGYPELKPRPDVYGTRDGLSKYPYIREARRLRAKYMVREQDISAAYHAGARARRFPDAVGIGHYGIDLHMCTGGQGYSLTLPTKPFQIPLGSLIAPGVRNFAPACKNIGVTHVANGAYRVHQTEWAIGEAAGALAVTSLETARGTDTIHEDERLRRRLQRRLVEGGAPIAWYSDVWVDDPAFAAVQYLTGIGVIEPQPDRLDFGGDEPLPEAERTAWLAAARVHAGREVALPEGVSRKEAAQLLYRQVG